MLVDSGNFFDNPTPAGDVRTKALLAGMQGIGYTTVNVGERDIRLGWDEFVKRTKDSSLTFISSNIVDKRTKQPVFDPYTIVEAASPDGSRKLRIGLIGIVRFNPIFSKPGPAGTTIAITHPAEPVRQAVQELKRQNVDLTVLLAAMHRDDAARLVRDVQGIDFVIGSYGGVYTTHPDTEGTTKIFYSGNQGKRVGVARVFLGADGSITDYQLRLHMLGQFYPSVQEMLDFVNEAHGRADLLEPGAVQPRVGAGPAALESHGPYAGSQACQSCHVAAYEQWESTPHAHALETLEAEPKTNTAACQSCHVTAAGTAGGFVDRKATPNLASVGCESCHGAGSDHAQNPTARAYGKVSVSNCSGCHTTSQSPDFDYYRYLAQVTHRGAGQGTR